MIEISPLMIPILGIMAGILIPLSAIWTKHRQKIAELNMQATAQLSAEKAAQYTSGVKELEERVRVLERIVTDKGYDVATQIEALRDQQRVDELLEDRRDRVS